MTKDIEEQFILATTLLKKAPWIKIICDRCDNVNKASIALEAGAEEGADALDDAREAEAVAASLAAQEGAACVAPTHTDEPEQDGNSEGNKPEPKA